MNPEHEDHLDRIKKQALYRIDKKYRQGQAEHGGMLWLKDGLVDFAIDEAIDMVVYLLTLKEQLAGEPNMPLEDEG